MVDRMKTEATKIPRERMRSEKYVLGEAMRQRGEQRGGEPRRSQDEHDGECDSVSGHCHQLCLGVGVSCCVEEDGSCQDRRAKAEGTGGGAVTDRDS